MRTRLVRVTTAVVLGLLLAGCGGDPSPTPAPYRKSPSTSASPTGPPTLPAEARGTTEASAAAFVRHYLDVLGYAARTGDTSGLSPLAVTGCDSCDAVIAQIRQVYSGGGHVEGKGYGLASASFDGQTIAGDSVLDAVVVTYKQRTYMGPKSPGKISNEARVQTKFRLAQEPGGWRIRQWTRVPQ